jgi:DNA-binding NarL/FixJ family response regulator
MMQKANVLIIEKDPDVGLILKEIVNREVHHISMTIGTADDVLAAEKMLSLQDYDVVVLGSGLGEAGWLALLRKITAEDNHPKVVVVSEGDLEETTRLAKENGACACVLKISTKIAEAVGDAISGVCTLDT